MPGRHLIWKGTPLLRRDVPRRRSLEHLLPGPSLLNGGVYVQVRSRPIIHFQIAKEEGDIKSKNKNATTKCRIYNLSNKPFGRPSQSRETISLKLMAYFIKRIFHENERYNSGKSYTSKSREKGKSIKINKGNNSKIMLLSEGGKKFRKNSQRVSNCMSSYDKRSISNTTLRSKLRKFSTVQSINI
jgi:hypothetical protein